MDYGNILYLTNFIKNDVSDREKELSLIYEKAVKESESFIALSQMKQVLRFFDNGKGVSLYRDCNLLLNSIFDDPSNGPETLKKMRALVDEIRAEEERSMDVLESFGKSGECISVISKEVCDIYGDMLNVLAHSFIYFMLVSEGEKSISELRWNDDNSLNVKLGILNDEILKKMYEYKSGAFFWKIETKPDDNRIRFSDFRYKFEYISYDEYNEYRKKMKRLRINLYADNEVDKHIGNKVLYVGMGNIVPCEVRDIIERLKDKSIMVVSPMMVCDLMNQTENAGIIFKRKRLGQCLFCGKEIAGKTVCSEHFKIERIS